MTDQATWLSSRGVTTLPPPYNVLLPEPGAVWRRCFTSPPTPYLNVPASEDERLDTHWSLVAKSLGFLHQGKNRLYVSLMGFRNWTLVEVDHDDRIVSLLSSSPTQPCFITTTQDCQHFLVLRSHEYHHSFVHLPLAEATLQNIISSPLDPSLFEQTTDGRSTGLYGTLTYLPLEWARPLHFGHLHDERGDFEFEIVKHFVDHPDVFEKIMATRVDTPNPLIRSFAYAPMPEVYLNLSELSATHDSDLFLFFAARALRNNFAATIDMPWLWRHPAAKSALLEMRRQGILHLERRRPL